MSSSKTVTGVVGGLATALAWGGMFTVAQSAYHHLDPFHLTAARFTLGALIFVALLALKEGTAAFRYEGNLAKVWLLGTVGFAGFNLLTYVGLRSMPAQSSSLVVATMPLVTVIVLWIRTGKAPAPLALAFVALALTGLTVVLGNGNPLAVFSGGIGTGGLLTLIGVICWVVYTTSAAKFPGWSPLRYTALSCVPGTISILAVTAVSQAAGWVGSYGTGAYTASWWQILYVAVPATAVAILSWNIANRNLGPANGVLFINLVPVTAFVISAFQGHTPTAAQLTGIGLVMVSLIGANVATRRHAARASRVAAPGTAAAPVAAAAHAVAASSGG
ncbi:DMT family transporter [Streptomyces sp. UNOC14_S4]|uniref:DMT family transporter n=1 Tax=Streptomyces sp. UNOC14_S4 TaxID=2872340 RepID=UPI001E5A62AD|nr:DMT family transporter [Streptomyces sp. UNOC14_S4]MCC3767833.1 DMT family transporter [Streptomyces sp. UNOC14_S4]